MAAATDEEVARLLRSLAQAASKVAQCTEERDKARIARDAAADKLQRATDELQATRVNAANARDALREALNRS